MIHHKLIDGLRYREDGIPVICLSPDAPRSAIEATAEDFARRMERAAVFVFENLPVALDGEGSIDLPGLEAEEQEMFAEGLIPLPFETCWFETSVTIAPGHREIFGFLVEQLPGGGICVRALRTMQHAQPIELEGHSVREYADLTGEVWLVLPAADGKGLNIDTRDPLNVGRARAELTGSDYARRVSGETGFVGWLTLMLSSRSTQVDRVPAPDKLNKQRVKRGRVAIAPHTVVSIIPRDVAARMRADREDAQGQLRASPRLHWRRSHRRTYASGKTLVIPRLLIGYKNHAGAEIAPAQYRIDLSEMA